MTSFYVVKLSHVTETKTKASRWLWHLKYESVLTTHLYLFSSSNLSFIYLDFKQWTILDKIEYKDIDL